MSKPDRPGSPDQSPKSDPEEGGYTLPSWLDAAISRSKGEPPGPPREGEQFETTAAEEELVVEVGTPADEPIGFTEARVPDAEIGLPIETPADVDAKQISSIAQEAKPAAGQAPRKGLALSWLLAALLFAAAAMVLAYAIWFKGPR